MSSRAGNEEPVDIKVSDSLPSIQNGESTNKSKQVDIMVTELEIE